mgnify:CR=1 FL=1
MLWLFLYIFDSLFFYLSTQFIYTRKIKRRAYCVKNKEKDSEIAIRHFFYISLIQKHWMQLFQQAFLLFVWLFVVVFVGFRERIVTLYNNFYLRESNNNYNNNEREKVKQTFKYKYFWLSFFKIKYKERSSWSWNFFSFLVVKKKSVKIF